MPKKGTNKRRKRSMKDRRKRSGNYNRSIQSKRSVNYKQDIQKMEYKLRLPIRKPMKMKSRMMTGSCRN